MRYFLESFRPPFPYNHQPWKITKLCGRRDYNVDYFGFENGKPDIYYRVRYFYT